MREIRRTGAFDLNEIFGVIRSQNRSLELTEDRLWGIGYGSDSIHLLFNLWYRDFNYTPAYENNLPQIDHIFPQSFLRKVKTANPNTGRMNVMRYREADRNQLANCMLLTAAENGAGGKSDLPPDQWFVGRRAEDSYLEMHLIPTDRALWKLERFEDFIGERKRLIADRFKRLLVPPSQTGTASTAVRAGTSYPKNIASLIDAGILRDQQALHLTYKGRGFTGMARRSGIELPGGAVYSPSAAAIHCYEEHGATRPTENGWQVWKNSDGRVSQRAFRRIATDHLRRFGIFRRRFGIFRGQRTRNGTRRVNDTTCPFAEVEACRL